jgi:hypothetical protein
MVADQEGLKKKKERKRQGYIREWDRDGLAKEKRIRKNKKKERKKKNKEQNVRISTLFGLLPVNERHEKESKYFIGDGEEEC